MRKGLKLFVWEDVLSDYTCGIAFALAKNVDEARELIVEEGADLADLRDEPKIYTTAVGYALWGGG